MEYVIGVQLENSIPILANLEVSLVLIVHLVSLESIKVSPLVLTALNFIQLEQQQYVFRAQVENTFQVNLHVKVALVDIGVLEIRLLVFLVKEDSTHLQAIHLLVNIVKVVLGVLRELPIVILVKRESFQNFLLQCVKIAQLESTQQIILKFVCFVLLVDLVHL
jgi:hypothetical protein